MTADPRIDCVSGGYRIILRCRAGQEGPASPLLPPTYFSLSSCLCPTFPDGWLWNHAGNAYGPGDPVERMQGYEARVKAAARFGLQPGDLPQAYAWAARAIGREFGVPEVFYTLSFALHATEWIDLPTEDWGVFGCGLHRSLASEFAEKAEAGQRGMGAAECVKRSEPVAEGGSVMGFELVNLENGQLGDSWLCNGLHEAFAEHHGIRPNLHGLLDTHAEAAFCSQKINAGEIAAEPGPWFPWLIVRYR